MARLRGRWGARGWEIFEVGGDVAEEASLLVEAFGEVAALAVEGFVLFFEKVDACQDAGEGGKRGVPSARVGGSLLALLVLLAAAVSMAARERAWVWDVGSRRRRVRCLKVMRGGVRRR